MLDAAMQAQLKQYLGNLREGIELVASLDDSEKSRQTRQLIEQIASLHDLVTARFDGTDDRKPSFVIRRASDAEKWVRFAGLPLGHEFTSLVLALLWAGGHPPKVDADLRPALRVADLVLVPVAASMVDLWATDGVFDLIGREGRRAVIVLNRVKAGTRLGAEVAEAAGAVGGVAEAKLGQRVVYAETLGQGLGAAEARGMAAAEVADLADEVLGLLG